MILQLQLMDSLRLMRKEDRENKRLLLIMIMIRIRKRLILWINIKLKINKFSRYLVTKKNMREMDNHNKQIIEFVMMKNTNNNKMMKTVMIS